MNCINDLENAISKVFAASHIQSGAHWINSLDYQISTPVHMEQIGHIKTSHPHPSEPHKSSTNKNIKPSAAIREEDDGRQCWLYKSCR